MRLAIVAIALLALTACKSTPARIVVPQLVKVPVDRYIHVPEELTRPCVSPPLESRTVEAVVEAANARKLCEDRLNGQMREIRGLGDP